MRAISKIFLLVLLIQFGCKTKEISDLNEYASWINDPNNRIVCEKVVGNIKYTAKFIPTNYFILKEINDFENINEHQKDSIRSKYSKSIYFHFKIDFDKNIGDDIMKYEAYSYKQYAERLEEFNFGISKYFRLKYGSTSVEPRIAHLENTYNMVAGKKVILVFNQESNIMEDIELEFRDNFFNTGLNFFQFKSEYLNKIPNINIL